MFYKQKFTTMGLKLAEIVHLLGPNSVAFCHTPCHDRIRSDRVMMERACVLRTANQAEHDAEKGREINKKLMEGDRKR